MYSVGRCLQGDNGRDTRAVTFQTHDINLSDPLLNVSLPPAPTHSVIFGTQTCLPHFKILSTHAFEAGSMQICAVDTAKIGAIPYTDLQCNMPSFDSAKAADCLSVALGREFDGTGSNACAERIGCSNEGRT